MIKIEDLDEFEGVTADMVRAWLRAKGFTLKQGKLWSVWVRETEAVLDHLLTETVTLEYLAAAVAQCSPQSLLREINPRMRAGWPSEEEEVRHEFWIAEHRSGSLFIGSIEQSADGPLLRGKTGASLFESRSSGWSFWPCDAHGNKVRRGA